MNVWQTLGICCLRFKLFTEEVICKFSFEVFHKNLLRRLRI